MVDQSKKKTKKVDEASGLGVYLLHSGEIFCKWI